MTKEGFKSYIQKKFGSVERYKKITETTQKDLDAVFNLPDGSVKQARIKALINKAKKVKKENLVLKCVDITDELRKEIRIAIYTQYQNINEFCEENRYTNSFVSELLNGKYQRISRRVKEVCTILNIETCPE